jgi:hypothetical protein
MKTLGIHPQQGLFYEGDGVHGRGITPAPTVALATVLEGSINADLIPDSEDLGLASLVFREDAFDPIARIRRGRFYERLQPQQPHQWYVQPHPEMPGESLPVPTTNGWAKLLHGFSAWPARNRLRLHTSPTMIAIGPRDAFTLWRPISVERIVTGEDLVTLKARTSFGGIPELNVEKVPPHELARVTKALDKLMDSANSESPGSLVESARKAAQYCLGAWLAHEQNDPTLLHKDLGDLRKKLSDGSSVLAAVSLIIGRLHVREKPNEQARLNLRTVSEGDGEFALSAVGLLLREIGWAQ